MDILRRTKAAWPSICNASAEDKNRILSAMADSLQAECDAILRCNAEDMDAARGHISDVMLDRLYLDKDRIDAMADGIRATVALPDHTGRILAQIDHPNGMKIYKKQVPLGLVAIIYESRPNVTSDAAALTIKSGNVCMLRSGKEGFPHGQSHRGRAQAGHRVRGRRSGHRQHRGGYQPPERYGDHAGQGPC
ncbi:glutamate-5-semialdehyde dehydrogenase, partial [human gut metagenome]